MNIASIEDLSYLINQAKTEGLPKPIVFLGAGASKTGGVPLASEIVKEILEKYKNKPNIKSLKDDDKTYPKLMACLSPFERNKLLKEYIDVAKINVTHIYLAQLIINGYIDYVLTVNFDNLMLRALALFNEFPPTYDMAILKDLTTTSFKEKSVVYLHGQHHGLWLLNTKEEMSKVDEMIPPILSSIKNQRIWIFIGYSGEDPIFKHITKLGRFDNGLYWVTYNDNMPCDSVCKQLLEKENTNAFIINGYDSDSFILKLNSELNLPQPTIIDKPFTALIETLNKIVDIDDDENFKGVKERLEISKRQINEVIQQYELGIVESEKESKENSEIDLLKKEIINLIISEKYQEDLISAFEIKVKGIPDNNLKSLLSSLYSRWGSNLGNLALTKEGKEVDELYQQSFEKYKKSIEIRPDNYVTYNSWGIDLGRLAKTKEGKEAEELYYQSFEKYNEAIEIKPDYHEAYYNLATDLGNLAKSEIVDEEVEKLYNLSFEKFQKAIEIKPDKQKVYNNWGNFLGNLAKIKEGEDADRLYQMSFEKFQKAIEIKPEYHEVYNNWGTYLGNFALTKEGNEAEELYQQSFEKFQKAIEIKPDLYDVYNNWGIYLGHYAYTKEGKATEELYQQSFEKFQKAIEIKPDYNKAFYIWGSYLISFAQTKEGKEAEDLYQQAFEKLHQAIIFGGECYNLACLYAIKGIKKEALLYLDLSLKNKEMSTVSILEDEDWKTYLNDIDFLSIIRKYE